MKKHLIAAAVAAAVVAPAAMAQNVSIYGVLDTSYGSSSNTSNGTVAAVNSDVLYSSRLGFRGTEDLGGGMKARFIYESGIATDRQGTANTIIDGRRGVGVYVSGGFGEIGFDGRVGNSLNTINSGVTNITNFAANDSTRLSNRVVYTTPTMSGLTGSVGYSTNATTQETAATKDDATAAEVSVNFVTGKLRVLAAYSKRDVLTTGDIKDTGILASYDFGVAQATLRYLDTKGSGTSSATHNKHTGLDVDVPLGNGLKLGLGYVNFDLKGNNVDATRYTAQLIKALSKRTNVYAAYARADNDSNASFTAFGVGGFAPAAGKDQNSYAVGITHSF